MDGAVVVAIIGTGLPIGGGIIGLAFKAGGLVKAINALRDEFAAHKAEHAQTREADRNSHNDMRLTNVSQAEALKGHGVRLETVESRLARADQERAEIDRRLSILEDRAER